MVTLARWSLLAVIGVVLSGCPGPAASSCADGGTAGPCGVAPECSPNPCHGARPVCVGHGGVAECRCPEGFAPEGDGCGSTPVFDCGAAHPGMGDPVEPDECPAQASTLPLGQPESRHTLAPAGDVDWFRVEAQLGHVYELVVTPGDGLAGTAVAAFGSNGVSALGSEARGAGQTTLRVKQRGDGPVLVRVRSLPPGATGGYLITAKDVGLDDVGDTAQDASPLDVGVPRNGALETGDDVDVFTVALLASTKYRFTVSGTPGLHLELRAPDDAIGLGAGDGPPILLRAVHPGVDLLRVTNGLGRFGPYTLTVDQLGTDDCGDTPADATALALGATKSGTLETSDDVDAYAITVQAQHAYSVVVSASSAYGVTATLVDANGVDLTPSGSGYSYGRLVFTAPADGTVFALVAASYSGGTGSQAYTVVVTDLGKDDYGDTPATATAVSVGASGSGRIGTTSDVDVLSFPVVAPHIYGVSCAYAYPLNDCDVTVTDALGLTLARSSGYSSPSTASFQAASTGTVAAAFSSSYDTGPYTWHVADLGVDDCGDDPSTATLLTGPPASGHGVIQFQGDQDVYGFGVDAGVIYQFSCTPTGTSSSSGSCGLALLDATGAVLTRSSSGYSAGSTLIAWKAQSTGTLFVDVTSQGAVPQGYRYGLAANGTDDYGDTRATAAPAVVGGPAQPGHFETPADLDVFTFAAIAGHVYQFTCSPTGGPCSVHFSDGSGTVLRDDGTTQYSSATVAVSAKALATGPLYVTASPGSAYSWAPTAYQWSIADLGPDDCGDTTADALPVTPSARTTAGSFEYGADIDVLSFGALAGELYRFTCTRPSSSSCVVTVRTLAGQTVAGSSYGSAATSFKAQAAGTLYAVLTPGSSYGGGVAGTYSWLLEDLGKDDYGDDIASATPITLNTPISGVIEIPNDTDSFSVSLTSGVTYQVSNAQPGSLAVTAYAPNGYSTVLYGSAPPFTLTASSGSGTYTLLVRAGYSAITPLPYTLTVK